MRGIASALLSAAIAAQSLASPIRARSPYEVKETHYAPREWTKLDRSHGDRVIQLNIGLKQGNWDELERHLHEGQYSVTPQYGDHGAMLEARARLPPNSKSKLSFGLQS